MTLGDLPGWPPEEGADAEEIDLGILRRCEFVAPPGFHERHQVLFIESRNRIIEAVYRHPSGELLRRVHEVLKDMSGLQMARARRIPFPEP